MEVVAAAVSLTMGKGNQFSGNKKGSKRCLDYLAVEVSVTPASY